MIPCGVVSIGDTFELGGYADTDGAVFEAFRKDVQTTMLVILDSPRKAELESLTSKKFAKVLMGENGSAFLMFKSSCLEFDMAINTKVIGADVLNSYDGGDDDRVAVNLIVVDSKTSKVAYLGMFTLPVEARSELSAVVEHQSAYSADQITDSNIAMMRHSVSELIEMSGMAENPEACLIGK